MRHARSWPAAALVFLLTASIAAAGTDDDPALGAGSAEYLRSCAVCHGPLARGDGPLAGLLTKSPPDLTALAARNGGEFPFWKVYETIDGRQRPLAHGTREMPIFGAEWRAEGPESLRETWLRGRLFEIILYLRSIQSH